MSQTQFLRAQVDYLGDSQRVDRGCYASSSQKMTLCPFAKTQMIDIPPHHTTSSGSQNCCESRIMFSRTSVSKQMLQVESGVLPAPFEQVSANKHQVPFSSNCFKLRSVELMPHLLKISSLEFGDVDPTHLGSPQTTGPLTAFRDISKQISKII